MPTKNKPANKSKRPAAHKAKKVLAIPSRYHAVTPFLTVRDAAGAITWYGTAFGAKELARMEGPDGKIMHAEFRIGDSVVMITDENLQFGSRSAQTIGGSPVGLMIYTKDVDKAFARASAAGAKVTMPVADQFWGDRYGQLQDPYGLTWSMATHKKDMTLKQLKEASNDFFAHMAQSAAE